MNVCVINPVNNINGWTVILDKYKIQSLKYVLFGECCVNQVVLNFNPPHVQIT